MDFKDILTQFDNMKGDEKKPVVERENKRPANMLTESTEVVEPVSNELKLPSLKNVFEELSLEPAKPGAQEIHKDGEPIGSVSNPQVANQMQQAMDKGELTIGQEMQEDEQLDELAPLAALGPALMTGARVAGPWLAKRGAQMMSAMGRGAGSYAKKNPIKTAVGTGVVGTEQGRELAGNVKDGAVAAVDGVNATFGAANDMIDSGKHMFDQGSAKIAELGDGAGGMIRSAIGDAAFDTVKKTASTYGLPLLAAVALLYGGKKVLDKVMDDDKEQTIKEAKDWIAGATKNKGAFTKKAKSHGMTTKAFAKKVLANKDDFPAKTEKQANLAKTLGKFDETDTPPESSLDLTSPISGGNMRESDGSGSYGGQSPFSYDTQRSSKMKEGAQYPADDGSHNSSNDELGNAAANAALAANDADTPQLVKEKAKGKVSKSSKLPNISKVKSMCNEGLSTKQIQQLHPKCNQQELNIMIKNTKQNLKEGADHILKAAKHMGHAHGLCKGSYACPHDAGSEGAKAYHEGYKTGLDEACGMGIKNEPIAGMEEGVLGGVGGAIAGSKLGGMAGTAIGGSIGGVPGATIGKAAGAALGGIAGDKLTGDGIFEEPEDEVVDTMASYGAMGEAESSPDGNVGADDDGAYDKYDWDAETVARKGIDEDDMDEGNAFSGAMVGKEKGDKFTVGDKTYTKTSEAATLEEDEWTFESLEKELNSHLVEGKESTKEKLDEGYTMSITSGEENQPDRVSVNATDAEADKLIKFVKDVGLGQYGDAEVVDIEQPEVGDVSFYGSPEVEVEPQGSHDDMLKLMGIVDVDGDYEDEVEAPGVTDVDVQVDDESCDECGGGHSMEEGCGDSMKEESDAEMDDHAERAGKEVAHDAHYDGRKHAGKDGEDVTKDLEYDDYKDKHHMEEDQGYDDKEDESLGMKDGKESGKEQSMKDRRDERYGKFGKRDEEHREKSLEETLSQLDELAQLDEFKKQGYDDREDESDGEKDGKESDKKQSEKDRRDDSRGKFGKRDKEDDNKPHSLEENLRTLDLLAEVGAETSEEPTQPLSQHDDERLLTKEGAEDAPKDSVNDGENEEITETQTDDQREFAVAEDDDLEEGKMPAGLKAYHDKKKGKKDDSEKDVDEACGDMKEEKLDEWANDAGKKGTDTSFEQDIDFMTKVISGGLNKQKSTGQTTIPVIAGQEDRMGYNGADLVKEGSVMSSDGFATILNKLDSLK